VTLVLAGQLLIPSVFAKEDLDFDKSISTRKCGEFELLTETLDGFTSDACRIDDGIEDDRFKTIGGKTKIHVPEETLKISKNIGEVIDRVLLDLIRQKVQAKFSAKLALIDFQNEQTFYDAFISMQKKILNDGKAPKSQIRKLLILFPEIEEEILKDNPNYKSLICRYEVWKHNQAIIKKVALALSVIELAAFVGAAPIAGSIILTANIDRALLLSQILIGGGVAGVLAGALQVENDIANWDQVTAAKNAKMLIKFYSNIDNKIKQLKKDPVMNKEKILEMQKWLPTEPEREQLKKTKSMAFKEYKSLFFGLSKVGLGVTMLYGGDELFKMISKFQKDSPAGNPTSGSIDPPWMK
jgi:hypothetical protein